MKTKLLRSLMLIAMLSTGTHAFAHDFEANGIFYNITSENTVEVTFQKTYLEQEGLNMLEPSRFLKL